MNRTPQLGKRGNPIRIHHLEERNFQDYPFGSTPKLTTDEHKERYKWLKKKKVQPPLVVYGDALLDNLELGGNRKGTIVMRDMMKCNLRYIFWSLDDTHKDMLLEFLSSLDMEWIVDEAMGVRKCVSWTFNMGGLVHKITNAEFHEMLQLGGTPLVFSEQLEYERTSPIVYSENDRQNFWRVITGRSKAVFFNACTANYIEDPYWRLVHRLVSMNLHVRSEGGRFVYGHDLDVMMKIRDGEPVDLMEVFGRYFRMLQNKSRQDENIGGGHVVTRLAKTFLWNLERGTPIENKYLTKSTLIASKMWDGKEWTRPKVATPSLIAKEIKKAEDNNIEIPQSPPQEIPPQIEFALPPSGDMPAEFANAPDAYSFDHVRRDLEFMRDDFKGRFEGLAQDYQGFRQETRSSFEAMRRENKEYHEAVYGAINSMKGLMSEMKNEMGESSTSRRRKFPRREHSE